MAFPVWRVQVRWLAPVVVMALLAACTGKNAGHGFPGFGKATEDSDATPSIKPLDTRLVSAHATNRISLPGFEDKQPSKGNHFLVLDVAVRNTDAQPRVFSEGQIIAADASRERTFPAPVNIFADGYLQLQVLPPSAGARGKIVYEIPDDASGVLYWVPGGDTRRILLRPDATAVAGSPAKQTRPSPTPADVASPPSLAPTQPAPALARQANAAGAAAPTPGTVAVATRPVASNRPADAATQSVRTPPVGQGSVTTPVTTQSTPEMGMGSATRDMGGAQARELACTALVSRNDPAEKKRYLGFFKRECSAYAMPSAWSSRHVATAAPVPDPNRWPPRPGPAFDCEQAFSPAEKLICQDAVLSLMDWEMTRAYASAQRSVDDPAALQREQDDWRWHVRNACRTVSCVETAYTERTADLAGLARPR